MEGWRATGANLTEKTVQLFWRNAGEPHRLRYCSDIADGCGTRTATDATEQRESFHHYAVINKVNV